MSTNRPKVRIPKSARDEFIAALNDSKMSEWARERAIGRLNQIATFTPDPSSMRGHPDFRRLTEQFAIGRGLSAQQAQVEAALYLSDLTRTPFWPDEAMERAMTDDQRERFVQSDSFRLRDQTPIRDTLTEALDYAVERQQERDRYVDEHIRPTVVKQRKELLEAAATVPDTGDPADLRRIEALMDIPSEEQWVGMLASKHFDYDPAADIATYSQGQMDQYLRDSADLRSEPEIEGSVDA